MVQPERAKADILGSGSGASAASARHFDILLPLWVVALLGLALNWQQNLGAKAVFGLTARTQAVLVALSAVESGVLGVDLRAALQREGNKGAPSFLGKYAALTDRNLVELQRLTIHKPIQQAHLARLRTLIKGHRLASDRAFPQQKQFTLAAILGQLGQMQRFENQLLVDRTASEVRQLGHLLLLEAATGVATVAMLVLATVLLQRERRWVAAANNEMRRSRERFFYLFEHANLGIAISRLDKNEGGLALQANAALATILGVSVADVEQRGLTAFLLPDGQVTQSEALDSMLENNQASARLTLPYRHHNGDTVWVDETMILRRSASGGESELFSLLVNITQLRDEEQVLLNKVRYTRSLIETSLDPLMAISIEGKIDDVNEATVQATGLPRGLLVGRDFSEFFTEPERARQGYQKAFSMGVVRDFPLTLSHCTGTLMPVLYNASTYLDREGKVLGVFAAARDVTQTRSMEEELRRLNATLEQKVQERTADLTQANEELESFAYSVSHDLRSPLRAIDGFSLKLVKSSGDVLDQEGRRLLQVVRDNALRMGQLIDDLLRFSRLGRRELEVSRVDMELLAKSVATELLDLENDRLIEFSCGELPPAQGDPALLREVWLNLLSNAIKFSRRRPVAHISVGGAVEGAEVSYWVKDDGDGFDMAYAGKLFGVFQRLHRQDEFEGTGVGLALVQRILHRHRGHIEGEGHLESGAIFHFSLPSAVPFVPGAPPP